MVSNATFSDCIKVSFNVSIMTSGLANNCCRHADRIFDRDLLCAQTLSHRAIVKSSQSKGLLQTLCMKLTGFHSSNTASLLSGIAAPVKDAAPLEVDSQQDDLFKPGSLLKAKPKDTGGIGTLHVSFLDHIRSDVGYTLSLHATTLQQKHYNAALWPTSL